MSDGVVQGTVFTPSNTKLQKRIRYLAHMHYIYKVQEFEHCSSLAPFLIMELPSQSDNEISSELCSAMVMSRLIPF